MHAIFLPWHQASAFSRGFIFYGKLSCRAEMPRCPERRGRGNKKPSKLAGLFIGTKTADQDLGGVLSGLGIFGPDLPRMPLRGACCSSKIFCCSGVSKA